MIILHSKNTARLSKFDLLRILKLKNSHWKYGLSSQKRHFKKVIKKKDLHNMLFYKKKLIGYTCLRKSSMKFKNKNIKYLLLDTMIIDRKFRKKNYTDFLMNFNCSIIKFNKLSSILYCKKQMESFYNKYNWKTLNKNTIKDNLKYKNNKLSTLVFNTKIFFSA